jgi:hypothetical protein
MFSPAADLLATSGDNFSVVLAAKRHSTTSNLAAACSHSGVGVLALDVQFLEIHGNAKSTVIQ